MPLLTRSIFCTLFCVGAIMPTQAQPGGLSALDRQQRPVPLPLDEAFPWYVSEPAPGSWKVTWDPAPGHYLYRHAFAFSLQRNPDSQPEPLAFDLADGERKTDQFFGDIQAYYTTVTVTLDLPGGLPDGSRLWIEYQGCADWGFCYPPQRQGFSALP
mgnify:CR=1 FL=1